MLRPATLDDLAQLFQWRNDPEFVALSHTKRTVLEQEHREWFDHYQRRIWMITYEGVACGVVWMNHYSQLAISIDSAYRNRGIGTAAIREFQHLHPYRLLAHMKPGNEPSRRLFAKAGFQVTCMEWSP